MKDKILAELATVTRPGMPALIEFLTTSDYFTAPASIAYHLAVPGGLAEHSWNVYTALRGIAAKYVPNATADSVKICGLMHDICKVNFYGKGSRNVKDEKTGKWAAVPIITVNDREPLGHGEKSIAVLARFISLDLDESLAIRWHMGAWDAEGLSQRRSLNQAMGISRLLKALMIADNVAAYFIEDSLLK